MKSISLLGASSLLLASLLYGSNVQAARSGRASSAKKAAKSANSPQLQSAIALYNQENYTEAKDLLEKEVKAHPNSDRAWFYLGNAYMRLPFPTASRPNAATTGAPVRPPTTTPPQRPELNPAQTKAMQERNRQYDKWHKAQAAKALVAYGKASKLDPANPEYYLSIGEAYEDRDEYPLAKSTYDKSFQAILTKNKGVAVSLYPLYRTGMMEIKLKRYSDAQATARRIAKYNPSMAQDLTRYMDRVRKGGSVLKTP